MRREDRVAFITTFTIFTLTIFTISHFSPKVTPETSCMEMCKVSLQSCTIKRVIKSELKKATKQVVKKTVKKKEALAKKQEKPLEKKLIEAKKEVQETPVEKVVEVSQEMVAKTHDAQEKKELVSAAVMDARTRFFQKIKEEINNNKTYPRRALRRSIEGEVKISFTIFNDGSVKINQLTGNKYFQENSKDALLQTFPISIPNELQLTFPLNLKVNVRYFLS